VAVRPWKLNVRLDPAFAHCCPNKILREGFWKGLQPLRSKGKTPLMRLKQTQADATCIEDTRFAEILKGLPRPVFEKIRSAVTTPIRHCKGFKTLGSTDLAEYAPDFRGPPGLAGGAKRALIARRSTTTNLGTRQIPPLNSGLMPKPQGAGSLLLKGVCKHLMGQDGRSPRQEVGRFFSTCSIPTPIPERIGVRRLDQRQTTATAREGLKYMYLMDIPIAGTACGKPINHRA